jgi:long-chain fatty acid transport protein
LALDGKGLGVQVVAGLRAKLGSSLLLGAVYKSPMKITFDGNARFQVPDLLRPQFPDGGIQSAQQFPQMAIIGLAVRPMPRLTVEADIQWTNWDTLNSQTVRFDQKTPFVQDTALPLNWRDTWTVRIGGNYQINGSFNLRAGYVYDPSAVPDETISPLIPELNKHMATVGFGLHKSRWSIDLLYEAIIGESRRVDNALPGLAQHQGEYQSVAHAAGLSILYRF